jgi:cytochrome oxidase Cu insertion factor (SCO1/SenC/PrrC family)
VIGNRTALASPAPTSALGRLAPPLVIARARGYFASDSRRAYQTALGLLWLLDGALQFQSFMYSNDFIQFLKGNASGQPNWAAASINWAANAANHDLALFNTLFAVIQVSIGLGLLYRRTVKPAIALSIVWALGVWWAGEGLGMIFAGTANPLTGAPGAVLLYAIVGVLVWPSERPAGLLSLRAARAVWGALWLGMAYLWLLPANTAQDATFNAIMMSPTGMTPPDGMLWLTRIDGRAEIAALGHGEVIALVLAGVSIVIAIAVWANWRPRPFLALAIVLNLGYWVLGQSFGGIFFTNSATDPNAGPLFVLLALVMYSLTVVVQPAPASAPWAVRWAARPGTVVGALVAACTVALIGTAIGVSAAEASTSTTPAQPVAYGSPFDGVAISPPVSAPPVSLRDYRGDPVTLSGYRAQGDTVLLTFLSADCATSGTCIQIATQLRQSLAAMKPAMRERTEVIAISTAPRLDTRASITAFLRRYGLDGRVQYLTGSAAQLRPVWREWGISAGSTATEVLGADAVVYGIAPTGAVVTRYSAFFTPQEIAHDVRRLTAF